MKLFGFTVGGVVGFFLGFFILYTNRGAQPVDQHSLGGLIEVIFGGIVVAIIGAFLGLLYAAGGRR